MEAELKKMLDLGVIRPSSSPWSSPVVLAPKKDGSIRWAVDYTKLNAITKNDSSWPMPYIEDVLDELSNGKFFSTLDAASSYWAVSMDPRSIDKTAFVTPAPCPGVWEFVRMPYGLSGAVASYQRLIETTLGEALHQWAIPFVDDVIVVTRTTFEDHLMHLQDVLNRLKSAGIKMCLRKSRFCPDVLKFLGHTIVPGVGVTVDHEKVAAINDFPLPKCIRQLRAFLGMTNYYKRLVEGYSFHAEPLTMLLKKDQVWKWGEDQQKAFDILKHKLMTAPILRMPSPDREFILFTDWSCVAIGAILAQMDPHTGVEYVVSYGSKKLDKHQRNYSPTEGEAYAILYFIQKYKVYLHGPKRFTVITDHKALCTLLGRLSRSSEFTGKWARYADKLSNFNYIVVYRPGKLNNNADGLTRQYDESPDPKPTPFTVNCIQVCSPHHPHTQASDQLREMGLPLTAEVFDWYRIVMDGSVGEGGAEILVRAEVGEQAVKDLLRDEKVDNEMKRRQDLVEHISDQVKDYAALPYGIYARHKLL